MDMERICNYFKKIKALFNFLLIAYLFGGCFYPKEKFGVENNEFRIKMGLEILPGNWKPSSVGSNYTIWQNPKGDLFFSKKEPFFFSKSISYNRSELISEEDLYYSGKEFTTIDGDERESLSIKYYFIPQHEGDEIVKGWYCYYVKPSRKSKKIYSLSTINITIKEADSILKSWMLKPTR
jgi:hypothetical protein